MNKSEFITNICAAATICAVTAIGLLGGGLLEGIYDKVLTLNHLPAVPAEAHGIITMVVTLVVVFGSGMAYMERR